MGEPEPDPPAGPAGADSAEAQKCSHALSDSLSSDPRGTSFHPQGALVGDHLRIQPELCPEQQMVHWEAANAAHAVEMEELMLPEALVAISVPGLAVWEIDDFGRPLG
nr:unnamed protein product [Digitaria exilis]